MSELKKMKLVKAEVEFKITVMTLLPADYDNSELESIAYRALSSSGDTDIDTCEECEVLVPIKTAKEFENDDFGNEEWNKIIAESKVNSNS